MSQAPPFPRLLGCTTCGAMHRAPDQASLDTWVANHQEQHQGRGEPMNYTEVPETDLRLAHVEELGGGFRVYHGGDHVDE